MVPPIAISPKHTCDFQLIQGEGGCFFPLSTTPELFSTLVEAFPTKPQPTAENPRIHHHPAVSPEYSFQIKSLHKIVRMIYSTTGNKKKCLFRTLSKGLLGIQDYHYHFRSTLLGFMNENANRVARSERLI